MSEQLRAALRQAANRIHGNESHEGTSIDGCPLEPCAEYARVLVAAPSTPEPGPLTYVGGVPHNHSHDRNRECREVLVGACLAAATSTPEPEIDVSEQ